MKRRTTLSTKIFLLAFVNLALLVLVFVVFARFQLHMEFNSFAFGAKDRLVSMARQLTLDLEDTEAQDRNELMRRYKRAYQVDFYLFEMPPNEIAGPPIELPPAVMEELRKPPPRRVGPPLPREEEEETQRGPGPPPAPPPARGVDSGPPLFEVATTNPSAYWVGARIPLRAAGVDGQQPGVVLMRSSSFMGTPLFFDYKPWLVISGVLAGVFVLCWLPFIRGLTRAVARMSKATEQIAQGRFEDHLPEDRSDELGALAAGINRMAFRLSGFVNGQKRFLGDIAHELCAPIARIQFALGILEHRTDPGTVDDLQEEVRQMSGLVSELLSFSKAGLQTNTRPLVSVDIPAIVRDAVAREGAAVELVLEDGLMAMADPESLSRAIANLVRNAVRYAGDAGPIEVVARNDGGEVAITVADRGPGIPEEEVERVFAPFYRVETSRNRESGGVGLGLSIVKTCIDACGGTVRCRNRMPTGLEVEIRLQLTRISHGALS
jgi:two-component system sensor histidine kinase CpxA